LSTYIFDACLNKEFNYVVLRELQRQLTPSPVPVFIVILSRTTDMGMIFSTLLLVIGDVICET
jgi:hypothetical protein